MMRLLAILILAFAVPLQAGAAACAHLCPSAPPGHADASHEATGNAHAMHDAAADDSHHGHHCDKPDASSKCCQGHGVMAHTAVQLPSVVASAVDRETFVARWASFIPEEPSPPPIVFGTTL